MNEPRPRQVRCYVEIATTPAGGVYTSWESPCVGAGAANKNGAQGADRGVSLEQVAGKCGFTMDQVRDIRPIPCRQHRFFEATGSDPAVPQAAAEVKHLRAWGPIQERLAKAS